jgi:hypothetical protein
MMPEARLLLTYSQDGSERGKFQSSFGSSVIRMDRPVFTHTVRTKSGVGWQWLLPATVAAVLLVLSHQARAGIVCPCREECVMRLTTGQAAPHSTATTDLCYAERDESENVAEIVAALVEDQSITPGGLTGSCCWMKAPHEHVATSAADPIQLSAFALSPASFYDAGINSIRQPYWDRNVRRSRPLYITQSCYRI